MRTLEDEAGVVIAADLTSYHGPVLRNVGREVDLRQRIAGQSEEGDCRPVRFEHVIVGVQCEYALADRVEDEAIPGTRVL